MRYEFAEGSSNKFWEIKLSKNSFTTTYGKIGTGGQTSLKNFASEAEAKKEHDKLVAEKVKKGYQLVGGGEAAAAKAPAAAKAAPKAKGTSSFVIGGQQFDIEPNARTPLAVPTAAGARYFEFVEGTSSKFWEVRIDGTAVKTRYGKIGTPGQTTLKPFGSAADAQKEFDKLVAEKTKKGYVESSPAGGASPAGGPPPPSKKGAPAVATSGTARDARNPELEQAILNNPTDRNAFAVLADWLQEQGDPRGELISLQLGNKDKQAKALIEKHAEYFLGPLAEHQQVHDEDMNNSRSHLRTTEQEKAWEKTRADAFLWRNGYFYRVRLSSDGSSDAPDSDPATILEKVVNHPSGRFTVEFAFNSNGESDFDLQDIIDVLAKKAPLTTRRLVFGDNVDQVSWHRTGNLSKLWKSVPNLQTLEIETGAFDVGKMVAPKLERAIFITGGLSKSCGKNIATADMPSIKHLEIYYGRNEYGGSCTVKEVQPLLNRTDLPRLEYLGLKNSEFADDIAKALNGAKILKGLKTLDLSLGTMTDAGAAALAAAKESLKHLDCLDLTRNYLTNAGKKLVKGLCKKVIVDRQEEAEDEDDRYTAIGE